jgi:hypothetical protein
MAGWCPPTAVQRRARRGHRVGGRGAGDGKEGAHQWWTAVPARNTRLRWACGRVGVSAVALAGIEEGDPAMAAGVGWSPCGGGRGAARHSGVSGRGLRADEGAGAPAVGLAGEEGTPATVRCGGVRTEQADAELGAAAGEGVAGLASGRTRARWRLPQERHGRLARGRTRGRRRRPQEGQSGLDLCSERRGRGHAEAERAGSRWRRRLVEG